MILNTTCDVTFRMIIPANYRTNISLSCEGEIIEIPIKITPWIYPKGSINQNYNIIQNNICQKEKQKKE